MGKGRRHEGEYMSTVNARGHENQHVPVTAVIPPGTVTPEVMIDVDVLDRNIARMASATRSRGLRLRPHAKTHKVLEIAERQLAAGAVGLTVATIGEAEV